jgi:hypothetical protein
MAIDPNLDVRLHGADVERLINLLEYLEGDAGPKSGECRALVEVLNRETEQARRNEATLATLAAVLGVDTIKRFRRAG